MNDDTDLLALTVRKTPLPTITVEQLIAQAATVEMTNSMAAQLMADTLNALGTMGEEQERQFREMKDPILVAGRKVDAYWRPIRQRIADGKRLAAAKLAAYTEELQRARDALDAKLRAEQRAEQERIAKQVAEREAAGQVEAARLRALALAEAASGNQAAAGELASRAEQEQLAAAQDSQVLLEQVQTTLPIHVPEVQKPTGVTTYYDWEGECLDLRELLRAILANSAPERLVAAVPAELNSLASALKGEFKVPGCVARRIPRVRRKA